MLPPLTVAACAAAFAVAAQVTSDTGVIRTLAVATAVAAAAGAALARTWDRSAGREVAELNAARVREEWRTDERVAELETDLEESREIRGKLETKLRAKRSELARLRSEHADLLRRYATAESERARALEASRRRPQDAQKQQPQSSQQLVPAAKPSPVGPAAFLKAEQALKDLPRNAARQQAQRTVDDARRREAAAPEEQQGRHAADPAAPKDAPARTAAGLPVREHRLVPAVAAAVLPYAQPTRSAAQPPAQRAVGGFDFFGTHKQPALPAGTQDGAPAEGAVGGESGPDADDAEHSRPAEPPLAAASEVIDLTVHDDTEQLDVTELRAKA
jgi:hypothetical protein